jgi:signal transduction histidine kinase
MELQLVQAHKLESIGQLAAGIAHEINTPTQYIGDNTRFLQDAFGGLVTLVEKYAELSKAVKKKGAVAAELITEVEKAEAAADLEFTLAEIPQAIQQSLEGLERVTKIVRAMKDFSHPGVQQKTMIDINHAIESTITVARNEWKYVAEMDLQLDKTLPLVPCLPGEINQVVLNLVVNAAHAIEDVISKQPESKGKITVSTRRIANEVEIRIKDTGAGIPEAVRKKIFEPFFTTKEVGKGTGQGLAIARGAIAKHGGEIEFESEVGRGTTFIIRLPLEATENG